ncbi:14130_t:CDS:2 [Entrophospora sp. SA101]|nr:14130_t:CDS:2 [Entrophospora sp. SA101]CAJ0841725.1 16159_t:CDS:2 [Entrophospora sp. SA101]
MNLNEPEESQLNFLNHELQKVIKSSSGGDNDEDYEKFINSSDFKTILSCFGGSKSEKVKTTSLIFLSKLIEKFYNDAEKNSNKTTTSSSLLLLFKQKTFEIISNWTNSTKKIDKLFGYNALLYIFKVFYELGEEVLNKAGFLEEMMDCVEFEDEQVQLTILEILSLACSQKNSRLLIAANCQEYLKSLMISKNQHLKSLSAVISTKIFLDEKSKNNNDNDPIVNSINNKKLITDKDHVTAESGPEEEREEIKLAGLFRNLVLDSDSNYEVRKNAIEGLAYSSTKASVKEMIIDHPTLLKEIFDFILNELKKEEEKGGGKPILDNSILYGVAVVLSNITMYRKKLDETEEQILKLKKLTGENNNKTVISTKIFLDEKSKNNNDNDPIVNSINNKKLITDKDHVTAESGPEEEREEIKLAGLFRNLVLDSDSNYEVRKNAIEGLAYSSTKASVKEMIIDHPTLLKEIFDFILNELKKEEEKGGGKPILDNSILYGVAVVLSNITMYRKKLDETEEQILKLKKLTGENNNKSKNNDELDPLDDDEHVVKRNKKLLSIGVNKILIKLSKNQSQVIKQLVANIYLNLARDRSNHGLMVQQGAIKALIPLATMTTTTMTTTAKTTMAPTKGTKENLQQYATQALAKIAITMNPNLVFRGERSTDLVKPLLNLCKSESELCQFESLMALTNLSSTDDNIRLHIYRLDGLGIVENLQLSDNIMVRRAATECLCNLMFCEPIFERYSDYEKSKNKIKVLVALSDVDDFETRRAASGCLAILSTDQNVCKMILERPRGLLTLKDLLDEQSVELQHRSVECLKNIASTNNKEMVEKLVESGIHKKLIELVKRNKEQVVTATCVETLKEISKHLFDDDFLLDCSALGILSSRTPFSYLATTLSAFTLRVSAILPEI